MTGSSFLLSTRPYHPGLSSFSHAHAFEKPNDPVALELMNHAARHVCQELRGDVTLAFGESDEYR
jgi:tRNA(His) guanylyltransferase